MIGIIRGETMAKIILLIETETDYSGCYYEGDTPSVNSTVFDIVFKAEDAQSRIDARYYSKRDEKNYRISWNHHTQELDVPKHVIKYLWDHRDD